MKNQKGFAHLFLILILIAGIGIGAYLVQETQIFSPKAAGETKEFFVSPTGNDNNSGTINTPFKTLERAKQEVRKFNRSMGQRIFVYLRGGIHTLDRPFELGPEDSGFNGGYVVYRGYQEEIAVISGGKQVTGWVQEGDKWKAPSGGIQTRLLFVNGVRAQRARNVRGLGGSQLNSTGYTTTDLSLQNFRNKSDIEIISNSLFRHLRCPVQDIVVNSVILKQPCFTEANQFPGLGFLKDPDWVENAYELLDQPGEWYLDKTEGMFYYKPRAGEDMTKARVIAPVLENLIVGHGTPANPIKFISFENLRFEHTTWNETSINGYNASGSSLYFKSGGFVNTKHPAAVTFEVAKAIEVSSNIFQRLGTAGLNFDYASQDNRILANHFTDLSADGILVGDPDGYRNLPNTPANEVTKGNNIVSNYVHDIGLEYNGAVAIWVGYAQNTSIAYNELAHLPYDGINVNTIPHREDPTINSGNVIRGNLIYDHMKVLLDGGGIYVNSYQPNSIITENVVHTQHNRPANIYLDNSSGSWKVLSNVIYDIKTPAILDGTTDVSNPGRTFVMHGCGNEVAGNFWTVPKPDDIGRSDTHMDNSPCTNVMGQNTVITDVSQAPQNIVANAGIQAEHKKIKDIDLNPPISTPSPTATPTVRPTPTFTPTFRPTPRPTPTPGTGGNANYDVNGDGRVNYSDALAVFRDLGKMKCGIKTDVNKDCRVNTTDIRLVTQNYTR